MVCRDLSGYGLCQQHNQSMRVDSVALRNDKVRFQVCELIHKGTYMHVSNTVLTCKYLFLLN